MEKYKHLKQALLFKVGSVKLNSEKIIRDERIYN